MVYAPEDYLVAGASYVGENDCDVYLHLNNLSQRNKEQRDINEAKCIAEIIENTVGKYDVTNGDVSKKQSIRT